MPIVIAATPIGNDKDATPRLKEYIENADVIAAEDTRRFFALASRLGVDVDAKVLSFYEHNEKGRIEQLISVSEDKTVLVVSDAGMPSISDPGFSLVNECVSRDVDVTVVPGPSAVLTALVASGLPSDRFTFEGFFPRKEKDVRSVCEDVLDEKRTMIFFESPRRLGKTSRVCADVFGKERQGAVCRELTKIHEEVVRAPLGELAERFCDGALGEIVVVIAGAHEIRSYNACDISADVIKDVEDLRALGVRLKDACGYVAVRHNVKKKELYDYMCSQ
ncbi:MAG: 16S rRNA (cytidine(1402)-2'-O)-methyltransferase [Actinomycetaceae bacterium]|nr:16S rRNA (cytidine(1402)-2'-O)-methyltransferase [Actinomycetaceae bacterium]